LNSRLRKLEERARGGRCPECAGAKEIVVVYGNDPPPLEHCPKCGRQLTIIRVVNDG
jgi:hypothetical protein